MDFIKELIDLATIGLLSYAYLRGCLLVVLYYHETERFDMNCCENSIDLICWFFFWHVSMLAAGSLYNIVRF